jgi:hypothetical protein
MSRLDIAFERRPNASLQRSARNKALNVGDVAQEARRRLRVTQEHYRITCPLLCSHCFPERLRCLADLNRAWLTGGERGA